MSRRRFSFGRYLFFGYVLATIASGIWISVNPHNPEPRPGQTSLSLPGIEGVEEKAEVRVRFYDTKLAEADSRPVILLIHGSPMAGESFNRIQPFLEDYRLVIPDMPGLGRSEPNVEDYSIETHATYTLKLIDQLGIDSYHIVGYSMGGGVGIHMATVDTERVESLVLLSSIGAQEYELLGDYSLNHAIHAAQLFGFWIAEWATPHFGALHEFILNYRYARNFYDTDQRPLRAMIEAWDKPVQIIHGDDDFLVPFEAALEHKRLLPHADWVEYAGGGHIEIFLRPERVARDLSAFIDKVERGEGVERGNFKISERPAPLPNRDWMMATLLAIATFVSEDLACIGGGLLVAKSGMSLWAAIFGCFAGIFIGDYAIYLMGRMIGPRATRLPVLRRFLDQERVDRCSRWFEKKGILLVVSTRFVPGSRVPTYFAAGVLKASAFKFGFALLVASAIWTPIIVTLAYVLGEAFEEFFSEHGAWALVGTLFAIVALLLLIRFGVGLMTWRGRRLLWSRIRRTFRWEFWPMWIFYPPVIVYLLMKMLWHRSITIVTAVNPCMPASGLVFESKSQILTHLKKHNAPVADFRVLDYTQSVETRIAELEEFMNSGKLAFPIVLKPDVGQRGQGVAIIKGLEEAKEFLETQTEDTIAQKFIGGREYGIFYYRIPGEESGRVLSITDKRFTSVLGDGQSTLEQLILSDSRAVCMARFFLGKHVSQLDEIIPKGQEFNLADLGTHCRGSLFLDGAQFITPELEKEVDRFSRDIPGYYFGRYDIRIPTEDDLRNGVGIQILELNGLTSESTNIYDPKHGLLYAYKILFHQWSLVFKIAKANIAAGEKPVSLKDGLGLIALHLLGREPSEKLMRRITPKT